MQDLAVGQHPLRFGDARVGATEVHYSKEGSSRYGPQLRLRYQRWGYR